MKLFHIGYGLDLGALKEASRDGTAAIYVAGIIPQASYAIFLPRACPKIDREINYGRDRATAFAPASIRWLIRKCVSTHFSVHPGFALSSAGQHKPYT